MGTTLNRHAYQRLIDEDLAWLDKQPRSLEREHIKDIVRLSPNREYDQLCNLCHQPLAFCRCRTIGRITIDRETETETFERTADLPSPTRLSPASAAPVVDKQTLTKRARQIIDAVIQSPIIVEVRAFSQPEEVDKLEERVIALLQNPIPAATTAAPVEQSDEVTLVIPTCGQCPFVDHSGAFTPGGAQPICGHRDAPSTFAVDIAGDERFHWKYRQVNLESAPPDQCPLRQPVTDDEGAR